MHSIKPDAFAIICGKGAYPRLLAESARNQGASRITAIAFRRETDPAVSKLADETHWVHLGQLGRMIDAIAASGMKYCVMAGQITPTHLFNLRMDSRMIDLLRKLPARNAETIFGAVADELKTIGVELLPASIYMEPFMPAPGVLSARAPSETENNDIAIGIDAAMATSALDIGQTVVVKNGTILAVEAFEGTNDTIRRAASLGGAGAVVVKLAKRGHDMRFDIPVIGTHTVKVLRKARASCLAIEAGRSIILEKNDVVSLANRFGISMVAFKSTEQINE